MVRQRVRIRFTKQDDLRWLSHRDLMRTWERLLRRAQVPLGMTEGFHRKPRMNFPSALAVGIAGLDELVEIELSLAWSGDELQAALAPHLPPGLVLLDIEVMPEACRKAQAAGVYFETQLPEERLGLTAERIAWLMAQPSYPIQREGRAAPLDLRPLIEQLTLLGGVLRMQLRVDRSGSARPREVLAALELNNLEHCGCTLTRTRVELASDCLAAPPS